MKLPLCDWHLIYDDYGCIGFGWKCVECNHHNNFFIPYIGERYICEECNKEYLSDFEED